METTDRRNLMRMMRTVRTVLLMALVGLWAVTGAVGQNRKALVWGNADYPVAPLVNPANDARDMIATLTELGFEVTGDLDLSGAEMEAQIDSFIEGLRPSDVVLLYFAGHGVQIDGENYLVPVDVGLTDQASVTEGAIPLSAVLDRVSSAGVQNSLVIMDACRDNPFVAQSRSLSRGLSAVTAPTGSMVVFATGPGQTASDGDEGNGLFTRSLLSHIRTQGLEVHNLITRVRADVAEKTNGQQVPFLASSLVDDFYFAHSAETLGRREPGDDEEFTLAVDAPADDTELFVNGVFRGVAPGAFTLEAGSHTITLRHPDYDVYEQTISADPGERYELEAEMSTTRARELAVVLDSRFVAQEALRRRVDANGARQSWATGLYTVGILSGLFSGVTYLGASTYTSASALDSYGLEDLRWARGLFFTSAGVSLASIVSGFLIGTVFQEPTDGIEDEIDRYNRRVRELGYDL